MTKEQYSIVWMYHTLLINASIDDHLDCFYFLAFVNDIAVNIHVQVCACLCNMFSFLLATHPGVEFLCSLVFISASLQYFYVATQAHKGCVG